MRRGIQIPLDYRVEACNAGLDCFDEGPTEGMI